MPNSGAPPSVPVSQFQLDAESVKVLAHPLRSRLLSSLRREGPSTATALAEELHTNSGATSYHLRKLESVGLVSDTGKGTGRQRLWASSTDETHVLERDFTDDEDAETALGWLTRDWLRHFTEKFGAWLDVESTWPIGWREAAGMNDNMVVVTDSQLADLLRELSDVVDRYRRVGQGNPDAKRVSVYYTSYPIDMHKPPRRRDS